MTTAQLHKYNVGAGACNNSGFHVPHTLVAALMSINVVTQRVDRVLQKCAAAVTVEMHYLLLKLSKNFSQVAQVLLVIFSCHQYIVNVPNDVWNFQ